MHVIVDNPFVAGAKLIYIYYNPELRDWDKQEEIALRAVDDKKLRLTIFNVPTGFIIPKLRRERRSVTPDETSQTGEGARKHKQLKPVKTHVRGLKSRLKEMVCKQTKLI